MYTVKFYFSGMSKQMMKDVLEDATESPNYYGEEIFETISKFNKWQKEDAHCNTMKEIQKIINTLRGFDFEVNLSIEDENVFGIDIDAI